MTRPIKKRTNNAALTRQKILTAAVKHFGAHGYQGASLRNIIADAGVNLGSANYHFGSKKNVYFAVLSIYFGKTREIRLDLLEKASRLPVGGGRLRSLIHAYISPHINLVVDEGEHAYGRLIIQVINDNELIATEMFDREVHKVRLVFRNYLRDAYPAIDEDLLSRGIGLVVGIMSQAPFDPTYRSLTNISPVTQSAEDIVELAVAFAYGGMKELFKE